MNPAFPGAAEAGAAELLPTAKWEEEFPNSQLYQSYFCPAPPPRALITSKAGAAEVLRKGFASSPLPPGAPRKSQPALLGSGPSAREAPRGGNSFLQLILLASKVSCLEKMS